MSSFVWEWNLVSHTEGEMYAEGVREEGAVLREIFGSKRD